MSEKAPPSVNQQALLEQYLILAKSVKGAAAVELIKQDLDLKNLRELEDLIIDVIYADIVRGKLDQKNSQLEVDYTIGRDIKPSDVATIISVLSEWCDSCEAVLTSIENQITKANSTKDNYNKVKQHIEAEIYNVKKNMKAQTQDGDDQMSSDVSAQSDKPVKKPKPKGVKGGGKFWQKS